MANLDEVLRKVIEKYAVNGANFESCLMLSPDGNVMTVVDVARDSETRKSTAISLILRLLGEYVVIENMMITINP